MSKRLDRSFYNRDVLEVAPQLLGQHLVKVDPKEKKSTYVITETEAYRGGEDLACHASKGRTPRTEVMFGEGGHLYMYLIYGMYWMMNVVTGDVGVPQAVLFRGLWPQISLPPGPCRWASVMSVRTHPGATATR